MKNTVQDRESFRPTSAANIALAYLLLFHWIRYESTGSSLSPEDDLQRYFMAAAHFV